MAGLWRLLGFDATLPPQVAGSRQQPATAGLTLRQLVYIILVEGLGALVIAGGANFGIAYAMYHHSNKPVKLWNINDNTLAGDAGVTCIVEMIATWVVATAMVCQDTRMGKFLLVPLHPVASSLGPSTAGRPGQGQTLLQAFVNVESMDLLAPGITLGRRFTRLLRSALCGFLTCIPVFFLWWPIAMGAMTGVGHSIGHHEYEYNHYPTPQVFKLIFGGSMGLLTVPFIAYAALVAMGRLPPAGAGAAELPMAPGKPGELKCAAEPTMTYNGLANGNGHGAQPSGVGTQPARTNVKPQV